MQNFLAGRTDTTGHTDWQDYNGSGVYVDITIPKGAFTATPIYITSLGGISHHWATTGGDAVYDATPTGFRVYVRWANGSPITKNEAKAHHWFVSWIAIEP